jgi:hypothetical protein
MTTPRDVFRILSEATLLPEVHALGFYVFLASTMIEPQAQKIVSKPWMLVKSSERALQPEASKPEIQISRCQLPHTIPNSSRLLPCDTGGRKRSDQAELHNAAPNVQSVDQ